MQIGVDGSVQILSFKCENSDCSEFTDLIVDEQKKGAFGKVSLSEPHTVELSWDGVNFIYGLDNKLEMFNPTEKAPKSSSMPENEFPRFYIWVTNLNDSDDEARISAKVDDVFVNENLYDDFSRLVDVPRGLQEEEEAVITEDVSSVRPPGGSGPPLIPGINHPL